MVENLSPTLPEAPRKPVDWAVIIWAAIFALIGVIVVEVFKFGDEIREQLRAIYLSAAEKPIAASISVAAVITFYVAAQKAFLRRREAKSRRALDDHLQKVWAAGSSGRLLPEGLKSWPAAILSLIDKHKNDENLHKVISNFLYEYAVQESAHISGTARRASSESGAPKNRIYTSFVSYSELVKVVLDSFAEQDGDIVCFATISMPLTQWFNNKPVGGEFPYASVEVSWAKYLEMMRDLAHGVGKKKKFKLYRIIKVLSERETPIRAFMPERKMRELANAQILLDLTSDALPNYKSWKGFRDDFDVLIDRIRPASLKQKIGDLYKNSPRGQLIIPSNLSPPDIAHHRWVPVWEAFIDLFSPTPSSDDPRAFVRRIDNNELSNRFLGHDGVPNDVFLVGKQTSLGTPTEWLFYFAGTTDEGCQMVRLEYGTQAMNGPHNQRIDEIKGFADETIRMIQNKTGGEQLVELRAWAQGS